MKFLKDKFAIITGAAGLLGPCHAESLAEIGYNLIFKILYPKYRGYHDVNGKPKIMKREVYEVMDLHSTDWFLDAELIINALEMNLSIAELPVKFESLSNRRSFVKLGSLAEFAKNLFKYRFKKSFRK